MATADARGARVGTEVNRFHGNQASHDHWKEILMAYRSWKITYTDNSITTSALRVTMYVVYKYDSNGSKYWLKQTNNESGAMTPTFEISATGGQGTSVTGSALDNGKTGLYTSTDRAKQQISLKSVAVARRGGSFTEYTVTLMRIEEQHASISNDSEAETWLGRQS